MLNASQVADYIGQNVIDQDGDKIGTVGQIYLDADNGEPRWAAVRTGFFGTSESFVPIDRADYTGDGLRVPYEKAFVKDAPRIDAEGALQESEEDELYRYYGSGGTDYTYDTRTDYTTDTTDYATTGTADYSTTDRDGVVGNDVSGPETDTAMTRSEERLRVGTEKVAAGRARLRKYIVSEQQQVTVPVTREEVRVEREPITDANVGDAYSGPELSEEEHEVVLTEERPVIAKETVPVERVRLDTETVTEQQTVAAEVRKEEIEFVDGTGTVTDADTDTDLRR